MAVAAEVAEVHPRHHLRTEGQHWAGWHMANLNPFGQVAGMQRAAAQTQLLGPGFAG